MTVLETKRLIIRSNTLDDLDNLHRLLSDRKNMYFLDDITTDTIEQTRKNLMAAIANADGSYFCIEDKAGNYIGQTGYTVTALTPLGKVAHMGYFSLPAHHGKGYMTEAVKRVLEFAFSEDGCIRITTGCYKDNAPSERVMIKAGFKKEGERVKAQYHDGVMKDRLEYALNKSDFLTSVTLDPLAPRTRDRRVTQSGSNSPQSLLRGAVH